MSFALVKETGICLYNQRQLKGTRKKTYNRTNCPESGKQEGSYPINKRLTNALFD